MNERTPSASQPASSDSSAPSEPRGFTSTWFLFLFPTVIWGTTWLTIKFQLGVVAPAVSVAYRFGIAALILFVYCAVRGISLRFDAKMHARFFGLGFLQYALNYVLIYRSETRFKSGFLAVLYVLVMIWNLLGGRLFFGRGLPRMLLLGALLGTVGVTLVLWPDVVSTLSSGMGASEVAVPVFATMVASAATLWAEKIYAGNVDVTPSSAFAMLYGSLCVFAYCVCTGEHFGFSRTVPYVASLLYLALFGSVFAFIGYLTLLRRIGSGRAGYTAVAVPVIAMAMSTLFEGQSWTLFPALGMLLVVAGNVLVLRAKSAS